MARVLVVDDEPGMQRVLSRALSSSGLLVDAASDGPEALERADATTYDLVLLDLILPTMSGDQVLAHLLARRPGQRVLVLSAIGEVQAKVRCLDGGAVDYLAKPFALAELLARVRARLRDVEPTSRRVDQPGPLQVGTLSLDRRRRVVAVGGESIGLSRRECLLLAQLMTRAGEICTREELLASVWGFTFDPGSNVVDVYVRRLRAKLPAGTIATVRHLGYTLEA
ncbi:MAG: response regulator transcription factor [Actinomycetota bacterium]